MAIRQEWMTLEQDWEQSNLRTYLRYDYWSPEDGLCILAGFDFGSHGSTTAGEIDWTRTLSPAIFQGHAGPEDEMEALTLLARMNDDLEDLRMVWANCERVSETERYSPEFFIEWALSKGITPDWMAWLIGTGQWTTTQIPDKTPSLEPDKVSLANPLEASLDSQVEAMVALPASEPRSATEGPTFTCTRAAMVEQHQHEWPSIKQDMKDAKRNKLSAAKAGSRGWHEAKAMAWARANNKLTNVDKSGHSLASALNNMVSLKTSRKHTLEG